MIKHLPAFVFIVLIAPACLAQGTLYSVTNAPQGNQLIAIDPGTGVGTLVGDVSFLRVSGLTYDPLADQLLGIDEFGNQLISIDPASGASAAIGPIEVPLAQGLALDTSDGVLFSREGGFLNLLSIDLNTGAGSSIGPTGVEPTDLAYDPIGDLLYGVNNSIKQLVSLNQSTGEATSIGPTQVRGSNGLAYNTLTDELFSVDNGELLKIDTTIGATATVGPIGFDATGLAFIPVPEPSSVAILLGTAVMVGIRRSNRR